MWKEKSSTARCDVDPGLGWDDSFVPAVSYSSRDRQHCSLAYLSACEERRPKAAHTRGNAAPNSSGCLGPFSNWLSLTHAFVRLVLLAAATFSATAPSMDWTTGLRVELAPVETSNKEAHNMEALFLLKETAVVPVQSGGTHITFLAQDTKNGGTPPKQEDPTL